MRSAAVTIRRPNDRSPPTSMVDSGAEPPSVPDGLIESSGWPRVDAAIGARYWIVMVGGFFVASTVMNRGMSRAGGGTGLRVVRRRLEPSAE
jgi:hypothetical protein